MIQGWARTGHKNKLSKQLEDKGKGRNSLMSTKTLRWALPVIAILIVATVLALLPLFTHASGFAYGFFG
jgi:hypothetical protein